MKIEGKGQLLGDSEAIENVPYKYSARCRSFYGELYKIPIQLFKRAMEFSKETRDFLNNSIFHNKISLKDQEKSVIAFKKQQKHSASFELYRDENYRNKSSQRDLLDRSQVISSFDKELSIDKSLIKKESIELILPKINHYKREKLKYSYQISKSNSRYSEIRKYRFKKPAATLEKHRVASLLPKVLRKSIF